MRPDQDGEFLPVTVLGLLDDVAIQRSSSLASIGDASATLLSGGWRRPFNLQIRVGTDASGDWTMRSASVRECHTVTFAATD
jgi:hypothetical protein